MSKTSPEVLEQIRKLALEGRSSHEIGKIIGKTAKAVQKLFVRYDLPHLPRGAQRGEKNHFYKRGWTIDKDGYKLVRAMDHPFCNSSGYIRLHRVVMEEQVGRYLQRDEVVHHADKNKLNNDPSNLKLFPKNSEHLKEELTGKIPKWSRGGIRRMKEALMKKKRSATGQFE